MNQQTAHINELTARQLVPRLVRLVFLLVLINAALMLTLPVLTYLIASKDVEVSGVTPSGRVARLRGISNQQGKSIK